MVVVEVLAEQAQGVRLVEHDDMIKALAAEGADEPFHVRILPRRARRRLHLADAEQPQHPRHGLAEDAVVVVDQELRRGVEGEGLAELPRHPLGARLGRDVVVEHLPTRVAQHQEHIQHAPRDRWHREEVDRGSGVEMVADKGTPGSSKPWDVYGGDRVPALISRSPSC